jgi:phage-related baseplate assembly protein
VSRFLASSLDLSLLPAPQVVETIDYETIRAARLADLRAKFTAAGLAYNVGGLETDPVVVLEEADAYRELLMRARINDAAKATMLAFAVGADLEHLAALYGVTRRLIAAATPDTAAVYESDAELRRRAQIAPEAFSTCGSAGSYVHHALEAAPELVDARPIVSLSSSGQAGVRVVCLARGGDGVPSAGAIAAVRARLNRADVKPMTVPVAIAGAAPVAYSVAAALQIHAGAAPAPIRAAAIASAQAMIARRRGLGVDVLRQAFEAALRVAGVERVVLTAPPADIDIADDQCAHCIGLDVSVVSIDD